MTIVNYDTPPFLICMIAINKQQSLYLCRAYTEKGLRIPNEILSPKYMFVLLNYSGDNLR